jgi:nitrogen fixation/metabolism regulation signal transduction histidine kinase
MVFKRFKYISIFYITLIIVLTGLGVYVLFNTYFWLTSIWIFIFDILLVIALLNFISKEHRKLSHFLFSIDQGDFATPFSKNFEDLDFNEAFEQLSNVIISLRDEAEINYQYLQTVVNQINTAIVCVNDSDKIVLANSSSNKLFRKNVLRDINSLQISNDDLPRILKNLKMNEKKLIKFNLNGELFNYSVQLAEFKLKKESFRLFSFQNVQSELEQNELESWQKLTRVMAHEIMNSAIPISNLSGLVYKKLFDQDDTFLMNIDDEQKLDIKEGLHTIETRSRGLVNFVEATRNFTKMPKPELEEVSIKTLLKRILSLLKPKIVESGINVSVKIEPEELTFIIDKSLIEQAFINLVINAIDALQETENSTLKIEVSRNIENNIIIIFEDNGKGISAENLENIFIPFFTTKREGSGIGLSLVKQIMYLHKGNITVKSTLGKGSIFTLSF